MEICKPRRGPDEEIYGGEGLNDPILNMKQTMAKHACIHNKLYFVSGSKVTQLALLPTSRKIMATLFPSVDVYGGLGLP